MVSDISVFFSLKKIFFLAESVSIDFLKTDTEKLIANSWLNDQASNSWSRYSFHFHEPWRSKVH